MAPAAKTPPAASAAAPHPESEARAAPDQATGGAVPSAQEAPPPRQAKEPARAARHMVAAANPLATEAGRDILRAGGGAVDAAIAAQMVLNLVEPQSSGIGGGGFMLHYAAAGGEIAAYDGREKAPRAAHPYMFLDGSGKPRDFFDAAVGGLSVGIPGLLRMLELAHREHGRLSWKRLFEPAISLAEKGFEISPRLHKLLAGDKYLKRFAAPAGYFYEPDGSAKPVGTRLVNRPLART
ncbi:MAG: gamma-glutamyltransferase, partial [Rhodospirillales bacterium]|nr:gamma-glutamyltransferase [Rhodospirillales bacterium]